MIELNKLNYTTRQRLVKYLSHISRGMPAWTQRVIKELVFGMITATSSCISEIGRSLNEKCPLHATIKRITKNLAKSSWCEKLERQQLIDAAEHITDESVIVIDGSDIAKPRAKKMEGLTFIHDGSKDETVQGYPYITAAIVNNNRNEIIPITNRLYSRLEENYVSDNDTFEKLVDCSVQEEIDP